MSHQKNKNNSSGKNISWLGAFIASFGVFFLLFIATPAVTSAATTPPCDPAHPEVQLCTGDPVVNGDTCGAGSNAIKTSINIGCRAQGNPIVDMLFAFIRFLSVGVGLVVVGSLIVAGIQYTSSRGDPTATAKALSRVQNTVIALVLYMLTYAILNFIVPGGILI